VFQAEEQEREGSEQDRTQTVQDCGTSESVWVSIMKGRAVSQESEKDQILKDPKAL
jgi:hypothetical protein